MVMVFNVTFNICPRNDKGYVPLVVNTSWSSFTTYCRVCNYINMMGATSAEGTAYTPGAHEFTPGF